MLLVLTFVHICRNSRIVLVLSRGLIYQIDQIFQCLVSVIIDIIWGKFCVQDVIIKLGKISVISIKSLVVGASIVN